MDSDEIYSGMMCRVSISCFAWQYESMRGASINLNSVLKTADGERLGRTAVDPEKEFKDFIEEEDDMMND